MSSRFMDALNSPEGYMIVAFTVLFTFLFLLGAILLCDWIENWNIRRKMAKAFPPRPRVRCEIIGPESPIRRLVREALEEDRRQA